MTGSGVPEGLLCSQAELDEMCRNGTELVHEAIDTGDPDHVRETYARITEARAGLVALMNDWSASLLEHLVVEHGQPGMRAALDADQWLEIGQRTGLDLPATVLARAEFAGTGDVADRLHALVLDGRPGPAKGLWAEVDAATLKLHDYRIDWVTSIMTHIYRAHGVEEFNAAQLRCARAEWWHGRMVGDREILSDPVQRIRNWSFFLGVGNWGTVSVHETADAFTIHHQVCGSCGRQELRGCHEEPLSFARVTEPVPGLNFSNPDYTIYRTHLAAWHFVMPIGEVGHPWPAINCSGVPGRCWFTIYKDPMDTPGWYYEQAGLEKPAARPRVS
jgi:hypothetical protein